MEHVLDNPAWNALISGNKHLSHGDSEVKFFDREVSPFVGFKTFSDDSFGQLYKHVTHDKPVLYVSPVEIQIPGQWKVLQVIKGLQMVCDTDAKQDKVQSALIPLTDEHIPQMLTLTKLTNPGPFAAGTIKLGHYQGVFEDGKLVAMAGQRLHPFEYTEISAVCTHPDYTGKGYARQLLIDQINRIKAASNIPFLHVRHDNERAIKLYRSLGFSTRTNVYFYAMQKVEQV